MLKARLFSLSLRNRITALTLVLFLLGIWSVTLYASRSLRADMVRLLGEQQFATVATLATQLDSEILGGMDSLARIAAQISPQMLHDPDRLQSFLADHSLHLPLFSAGTRVTGMDARTLASIPYSPDLIGVSYADRDFMIAALRDGRASVGRPVTGKVLKIPVIGLAVPIWDPAGRIIGAVFGAVNLNERSFFDKIVASRHGISGGFLIIAPQHDLIVTATDKSRMMGPAPPAGANAMNDRYVAGYEGYGVAVSSRGVEELSAAKRIPSAGWFLVGVLPTAEAFAPIKALEQRMLFSALLISVLAGTLAWLTIRKMLRQQFTPLYNATRSLAGMSHGSMVTPAPLPIERDDEIGELIGSFNHLLATLGEREQHFRTLANGGSALIWTSGTDKLCNYFNEPWLRFTGRSLDQELNNGWVEGVHPDDLDACMSTYLGCFERRESFSMEYRLRHADGDYRWIIDQGNPRFDSEGNFIGYIGFCYDISERKRSDAARNLAASVFSHAREGIMITDANAITLNVNESFTRITGYTREEILGRNPRLLSSGKQDAAFYATMWQTLASNGHWSGEIWDRRKCGEIYPEQLTITAVRDDTGRVQNYVALFADITLQKQHQSELEHVAHYDALTGLPNRVLLADRLRQAMAQSERRQQLLGVAYIDLDGFKAINDTHGHQTGDQFLVTVSQRMKTALREGDTLARLGGDEFIAVMFDLSERQVAYPVLDRLLAAAAEPVHSNELVLKVSASIGVTLFPQNEETDADQLLRQADQAMYQAKLGGKNRYHFFDLDQDRSLRGRHESIERIREALQNHEFVLHYQPKVNMQTGQFIGVEALIRWRHPELGLLAPGVFLPVIEDHPLAVEVGEWVIGQALREIAQWQQQGMQVAVSVNLGTRQLQQPDFIARLESLLCAQPDVAPDMLQLEVLETSALEDIEQVSKVIDACRNLGIGFALDDFGTGYSSLTYLKRLPARMLKIDQSFVRDMLDDADDLAILEGILGLASAFTRDSIAEGVETEDHGELLIRVGCRLGQGFGIARPMPATELSLWRDTWHPPPAWIAARRVPPEQLPTIYATIEHRTWIKGVTAYLNGFGEMPPEMDNQRCRFGVWLKTSAAQTLRENTALFARIDDLHGRVHQFATTLTTQYARGEQTAAREQLPALHTLRDQLLAALDEHLQTEPSPPR